MAGSGDMRPSNKCLRDRARVASTQPVLKFNTDKSREHAALISRGLTREQAAEFAGISPSTFDKYRREGKFPGPTLPGGRYDKRLLESKMDGFSGIAKEGEVVNALDSWRASRARSGSRS
jgi:hypothetical protein